MKFSALNVFIILTIISFSKCSDSSNDNKELSIYQDKINNIAEKPKDKVSVKKPKSDINSQEKKINEKLSKISQTHESFYHQNDKLIESIKNQKEVKKSDQKNHHQFIEKKNPTEVFGSISDQAENAITDNQHDNFHASNQSALLALSEKQENKKKKNYNKKNQKSSDIKKNFIDNPIYNNDIKNKPKEFGAFKKYLKCNTKSDSLYIRIEDQEKANQIAIALKPIFAVLNKFSINLQNGLETSTLFRTIPIKKIIRISQQEKLRPFFCFDLLVENNSRGFDGEEKITLCSKSLKEKTAWVNTFQEFKECQVQVQNIDHNDKLIFDFSKINELLKNQNEKSTKSVLKPEKAVKSLYYDNTNPTVQKSDATKAAENKVSNIVNKIMKSFQTTKIRENQVRRDMENKLKVAKKFREEIASKEKLLVRKITDNVQKEKMKQIKLIGLKTKAQEIELLNAVENKVEKMRQNDIKNIQKTYSKQIMNEQKTAENQASSMMNIIVESKKFSDYYECTDEKVFKFEDKPYLKQTCKRIFGEFGTPKCMIKSNFCNMCCNHHVGLAHTNKLFECKKNCKNLINGIKVSNGKN